MITTYSAEYKALTTSQKAKVRKAIAAYHAERDPIMYEANRHENEVRRQAYIDLNCQERRENLRAKYDPQIAELKAQSEKIWQQIRELETELSDKDLEISTEPYQAAYADPKREVLHDVWKAITERHEAKMADLLASFKTGEVA